MDAIFTSQAEAQRIALRELKSAVPGLELQDMLAPGTGLVRLPGGFSALAVALRETPPVFVRHTCPAQAQVPLTGTAADLPLLQKAAQRLLPGLAAGMRSAVQTRGLGALGVYKCFDVNTALAQVLTDAGLPLDVRNPEQVLSVVLSGNTAYLGASSVRDNRSDWAGGCRRFAREQARISRAEFKLLEALEVFGIPLPQGGHAVDLGAAPGGWTQVLLNRGLRVTAVDPARLDTRLTGTPGITHRAITAQAFLREGVPCDLLVNDMKMDSDASAALMVEAAACLAPGGWAVLTLKLPGDGKPGDGTPDDGWFERTRRAVRLLQGAYATVEARQLFHNRSEVTCVLRMRD